MDFNGIAWVGKIQEKLENLCSEVDDLISQETIKYVEDQLQTAGANVKQYCSEFVQDFFLEEDKITDLTDDKNSKEDGDKDSNKEISKGNCLLCPSIAGPVEGEVGDLTLKKNVDASMQESSIVGVEENPTKIKPILSEIPKHEAIIDDEVNMSTLTSIEKLNSSLMEGQDSTLANSSDGISESVPTSNFIISVGSCEHNEHNVMDSGSTSHCDALSTISSDTDVACATDTMTETHGVGSELCDGSAKSHLMPLLGFETVDDSGEEETLDDLVTKPGKETTEQPNEWKLGESCIVVDSNEICTEPAKHQSYKKKVSRAFAPRFKLAKDKKSEQQAIRCEDLKAGPAEQRRESFAPSWLLKSASPDFCESEWVII